MNQDFDNGLPFPIPISPAMPMDQQFSLSSLYPGMNTQPTNVPSYNFGPSYKRGGHLPSLHHLASQLQNKGEDGDDILAYINPEEYQELSHHFGHDINPHTGLPQFGLFGKVGKKFFKGYNKFMKKSGIGKLLPIAGAVAGNFFAPGIGGVIGGGLGGALSGSKKPLKPIMTGAGLGALQGFGLPALGNLVGGMGAPGVGQGLSALGGSRFGAAFPALGQGLGLSGLFSSGSSVPQTIEHLESGHGTRSEQRGAGGLLDYLLLGGAAAGILGGKTKYKMPKHLKKEPSLEEYIQRIRNAQHRPEDMPRQINPYEYPENYFDLPQMRETPFEYPEYQAYKKGGHVNSLKKVAEKIRKKGTKKDKILAHINPEEAEELEEMSGSSKNKKTGLPQFGKNKYYIQGRGYVSAADFAAHKAAKRAAKNAPPIPSAPSTLDVVNQALSVAQQMQPEGPSEEKREVREESPPREINPYQYPQGHFDLPQMVEKSHDYPQFPGLSNLNFDYPESNESFKYPQFPGFNPSSQEYPKFKEGGFIEGDSGGQDDDRPVELPENGYVVDATTVSLIGDGNTLAGKKKLGELLSHVEGYAKGAHVESHSGKKIPALVSDGEYYIYPHEVTAFGEGDNKKGAKNIKQMINKIRKQKGVKGLPPKSKPLTSYLGHK